MTTNENWNLEMRRSTGSFLKKKKALHLCSFFKKKKKKREREESLVDTFSPIVKILRFKI